MNKLREPKSLNCTPKVGHKTFGVFFMKYSYEQRLIIVSRINSSALSSSFFFSPMFTNVGYKAFFHAFFPAAGILLKNKMKYQ